MYTASKLLRNKRESLHLDIKELADTLNVDVSLLKALELSDYSYFENLIVSEGFAFNYAEILELDPFKISAFWRRDYLNYKPIEKINNFKLSKFLSKYLKFFKYFLYLFFLITPFIVLFLFYTKLVLGKPELLSINILNNDFFNNSLVEIKGKVSKTDKFFINDKSIILDEYGNFKTAVNLTQGTNVLNLNLEKDSKRNFYSYTLHNTADTEDIIETVVNNLDYTLKISSKSDNVFLQISDINNANKLTSDSLYIENTIVNSNFEKQYNGDRFFLYTNSIENLNIFINDIKLDIDSTGVFSKDLVELYLTQNSNNN